MIRDSRELKEDQTLDADLCVIGAGAAGITICNELIGTSVQVILLESGGLQYDPQIQSLYAGEVIGYPAPPLTSSRLRYFGGTTNLGSAMRAARSDRFRGAFLVPYSGWPFDRPTLTHTTSEPNAIADWVLWLRLRILAIATVSDRCRSRDRIDSPFSN